MRQLEEINRDYSLNKRHQNEKLDQLGEHVKGVLMNLELLQRRTRALENKQTRDVYS